jgi:hypothetical protein
MCIPAIAYMDYLAFGNSNMHYKDEDGSFKKIKGNEWYVASFLEIVLFLAGFALGVNA